MVLGMVHAASDKSELVWTSSLRMLLLKVSSTVAGASSTSAYVLHQLRTGTQDNVSAAPSDVAEPTASARPV